MLNKKGSSAETTPSDLEFVQQGDDLDSLLDSSMVGGNSKTVHEEEHDNEMGAVDDLMKEADTKEKNQ